MGTIGTGVLQTFGSFMYENNTVPNTTAVKNIAVMAIGDIPHDVIYVFLFSNANKKMYDYLSTACRSLRYCIAIIGFLVSAAFISFGVYLRMNGTDTGLEDDAILGFGIFVALQSCIIATANNIGDRMVSHLIGRMESQMNRLNEANEQLEGELKNFDQHNKNYAEANTQFRIQLEGQRTENKSLMANLARLGEVHNDMTISMGQLKKAHAEAQAEINGLRELAGEGKARIDELEALSQKQQGQIQAMEEQLKSLNVLQRKSVRMIQMLSMYGDECKTLGVSLKDVAQELRKTDESLGLTSQELTAQLNALQTVTAELKKVAQSRGIDEDDMDDDDYVSVESQDGNGFSAV